MIDHSFDIRIVNIKKLFSLVVKDPFKNKGARAIFRHLIRSGRKPNAAYAPTPMMFQLKFGCYWPAPITWRGMYDLPGSGKLVLLYHIGMCSHGLILDGLA